MQQKCRLSFGICCGVAVAALAINIVLWLVKPSGDYLLTGIWNIAEVFPFLTVIIVPTLPALTMLRFAEHYAAWFRVGIACSLMIVLVGSMIGLLRRPDWLMLPDLYSRHGTVHPPVNCLLAWGALCALMVSLICLPCIVFADGGKRYKFS
ncbi:hypothetical protein G1C95_1485 [Bifidobacterium sp. DSM 109957]|uniref:Uncharacterized protein n=2 Tax=Bifidobacterium oedipodis TaxID=2675322 RepID=A0A7Y0EPY5_9BIFI|nr:hypothetical protein [Bifidobacterium sp. DSM 109957]